MQKSFELQCLKSNYQLICIKIKVLNRVARKGSSEDRTRIKKEISYLKFRKKIIRDEIKNYHRQSSSL